MQKIQSGAKLCFLLAFSSLVAGNAWSAEWNAQDFANLHNKRENMKILIIGAHGSVARWVIEAFLKNTDVNLVLFLRNAKRLERIESLQSPRVQVIEGDATDKDALKKAMQGVNVVYANLAGNLAKMATTIVGAMNESKVERLIWISSYGIYQNEYHEIPTQAFGSISPALAPYRESALIVEGSNLKYTIIRPCWFSNADEIDYELTQKGEAFKNPSGLISRKSIAHLVVRLALEPDFGIRQSLGINKP